MTSTVGVIAIGRNEGERLDRCLRSLHGRAGPIVYVDSGSDDGSVELARGLGAAVVELDTDRPFSAARARNAGIAELRRLHPGVQYVQVLDGDCALAEGWIEAGMTAIEEGDRVAVVCGRRRELDPAASRWNRLCDMEWDTPVGEAEACGGDALLRLEAFDAVGGYDGSIIAGEEPEMCLRLRRAGWRVMRIDHEMTLHDARMTRFGQWWRRAVRHGHAVAEGYALHGRSPQRFCTRTLRSIIVWALLLPLLAIGLAWATYGISIAVLLALELVLWLRVRAHRRRRGDPPGDASLYATYTVLGKFAELQGVGRYVFNRARGRRSAVIEYKGRK